MRRLLGRGLTAEELERVLRRYPGDLPERRDERDRVSDWGGRGERLSEA